jgi:hypothetical protein
VHPIFAREITTPGEAGVLETLDYFDRYNWYSSEWVLRCVEVNRASIGVGRGLAREASDVTDHIAPVEGMEAWS